jgi:membrane-associated progesterone receptor component
MGCGMYIKSSSVIGKQMNNMDITWLTSMLLSFGISIQTTILTGENQTKDRDIREGLFDFLLVFGLCFTACCVYWKNILKKQEPQGRETSRMIETSSLFELREYSLSELNCYNGSNGTIYIALNGKIFDVTKDKKQFDSGGCYKMLAGRDASRAFATLSFDINSLRSDYDDLSDLNDIQKTNLEEWERIYTEKYNIMGKLVSRHRAKSLQDIAMNSIIKNIRVSHSNTHSIDLLPLPGILKRELRNFFYEHME